MNDIWDVLLLIHLLAMAFFVGGQLVLATVLVPVMKGKDDMKLLARRFGHLSGIALLISIVTGLYIAQHQDRWGDTNLQIKIGLLVVLFGLIAYHIKNGDKRWLDPVIFVLTLAVVVFGVALGH